VSARIAVAPDRAALPASSTPRSAPNSLSGSPAISVPGRPVTAAIATTQAEWKVTKLKVLTAEMVPRSAPVPLPYRYRRGSCGRHAVETP